MSQGTSNNLRHLGQQALRFGVVGGASTVLHYAVLAGMVEVLHTSATLSSTCGFVLSAALNYYFSHRYTFRSHEPIGRSATKFCLVACAGLGINALCMYVLEKNAGLHYLAAQLLSTCAVLLWNFNVNRHWTFRAAQMDSR